MKKNYKKSRVGQKLDSNKIIESKKRQDSKKKLDSNKIIESKKLDSKNGQKAYILLAKQENISLNKAKNLIDSGLVSVKNSRVQIGREIVPKNTHFSVLKASYEIIFEDSNLLVIDKGVGVESYALERHFKPYSLINRLDKDTSGIILLAKNETTRQNAIKEFKERKVKKTYLALVSGKIVDEISIKNRIKTKKDNRAKSYVLDSKNTESNAAKEAISIIAPLSIIGNKTLVEVKILTGVTHQIRVHLSSLNHAIIGDVIYNKDSKPAKRLMLHCQKTAIFNHEFVSKKDIEREFGI